MPASTPIPDCEIYPHTPGLAQAAPLARSLVLTWEDRFLVRFRLRPGDIETCDDGRVLYARDAFGPSTEERLLPGCNVDRDEEQSRIRILQREEARSWLQSRLLNKDRPPWRYSNAMKTTPLRSEIPTCTKKSMSKALCANGMS